jgi:hypothetical protein
VYGADEPRQWIKRKNRLTRRPSIDTSSLNGSSERGRRIAPTPECRSLFLRGDRAHGYDTRTGEAGQYRIFTLTPHHRNESIESGSPGAAIVAVVFLPQLASAVLVPLTVHPHRSFRCVFPPV